MNAMTVHSMQKKFMANQAVVAVEALLGVNAKAGNTRLCLADAIMSGLPVQCA